MQSMICTPFTYHLRWSDATIHFSTTTSWRYFRDKPRVCGASLLDPVFFLHISFYGRLSLQWRSCRLFAMRDLPKHKVHRILSNTRTRRKFCISWGTKIQHVLFSKGCGSNPSTTNGWGESLWMYSLLIAGNGRLLMMGDHLELHWTLKMTSIHLRTFSNRRLNISRWAHSNYLRMNELVICNQKQCHQHICNQ